MFPQGESIESEVTVGSVWIRDDLIASTTFEILKDSKLYEEEKDSAVRDIQPIFLRDNSLANIYIDSQKYNVYLKKLLSKTRGIPKNTTFMSDNSFAVFHKLANQSSLYKSSTLISVSQVFFTRKEILINIFQRGLLNLSYNEISRDSISVRDGKFERIFPKSAFLRS